MGEREIAEHVVGEQARRGLARLEELHELACELTRLPAHLNRMHVETSLTWSLDIMSRYKESP